MSNRTLVAYITSGGATREYANVIADVLRSRGHEVVLLDLKREVVDDLSPYDLVVLGMGVRMFMVYRKGKQFLARRDVQGKKLAIFLSSAMAIESRQKARERFLRPLVERYGLSPVAYDALPGKMPVAGAKLEDRTDPAAAREWAVALDDLTAPP